MAVTLRATKGSALTHTELDANFTSESIGEPKGAAAASDGQMYIADGAGSGAFEDNSGNVHGDAIIASNTTATAITAAVDATLATDSDYVKVTAGWSLAHARGVTLNVDEIVVPVSGTYFITFWADILVPLTNNFVGVKYAINDTAPYSTRKVIAQSQSTSDFINLSASGVVASLSANDTLSVYVAGTKTDNLIVQEAGLIAMLLHET
jgi:hypothetical protein